MKHLLFKIFIISILLIASELFLGWWAIVLVPFLINLLYKSNGSIAAIASFISTFAVWFGYAYYLHTTSQGILTGKIAEVLTLGADKSFILIVITGLVGGIMGSLSGYTGNALRNVMVNPENQKKNRYERPDYRYRG